MRSFILDTGVLLGLTRRAQWARRAFDRLELNGPETTVFTSVVCHGEMLALAEKNGWGEPKRRELGGVLAGLPQVDISKCDVLKAYALVDAWTQGSPVAAPNDAPPPKPAKPMSKNDLWIAATAHASGAVLVTTDKDFDHLHGVWLNRELVDMSQ